MLTTKTKSGRVLSDSAAVKALSKVSVNDSMGSGIIFARGHQQGRDPGAVFRKTSYAGQSALVTETDIIATVVEALAKVFAKDKVTLVMTVWMSLSNLIRFFRRIFSGDNASDILVQIHADYAVPDVNDRPATYGFYYASIQGKQCAENMRALLQKQNPDAYVWVRSHTESPRQRLAFVSNTKHVALIAEVDFINRADADRKKINDDFANAMLQYAYSYGNVVRA